MVRSMRRRKGGEGRTRGIGGVVMSDVRERSYLRITTTSARKRLTPVVSGHPSPRTNLQRKSAIESAPVVQLRYLKGHAGFEVPTTPAIGLDTSLAFICQIPANITFISLSRSQYRPRCINYFHAARPFAVSATASRGRFESRPGR